MRRAWRHFRLPQARPGRRASHAASLAHRRRAGLEQVRFARVEARRCTARGGLGAERRGGTLSSSALQAFFSMAVCTRFGLVTSRSSPTTCAPQTQGYGRFRVEPPPTTCPARAPPPASAAASQASGAARGASAAAHGARWRAARQARARSEASGLCRLRAAGRAGVVGARLAHALGGELGGVVPIVLVEGVLHRDDGVVRRDLGVQLQQALPARRAQRKSNGARFIASFTTLYLKALSGPSRA